MQYYEHKAPTSVSRMAAGYEYTLIELTSYGQVTMRVLRQILSNFLTNRSFKYLPHLKELIVSIEVSCKENDV